MLGDRFDYLRKGLGVLFGEEGENLSIESHLSFSERGDEFAVRDAVFADLGVYLYCPEGAHVCLFVTAVREGVLAGMENGLAGLAFLFGAAEAEAFRLAKNVLAAACIDYSSFDARHGLAVRQKAALLRVGHLEFNESTAVETPRLRLLGVEMILSGFARQNLPLAGDPEPFGE